MWKGPCELMRCTAVCPATRVMVVTTTLAQGSPRLLLAVRDCLSVQTGVPAAAAVEIVDALAAV